MHRLQRAPLCLLALSLLLAIPLGSRASDDSDSDSDSDRRRGHRRFALELPGEPILAGDLLTLHGRRAFGPRFLDRLRVRIGDRDAELYAASRREIRIVVPPGVSGEKTVRIFQQKRRHRRLLLKRRVDFAPTQIRTNGPGADGLQFGLRFSAAKTLSVGSTVEGWALADGVSTKSTTSPVSVTGSILSNDGTTVSLLLTGTDSPESPPPPDSGDPRVTTLDDTTLELRIDLEAEKATGSLVSLETVVSVLEDVVLSGVELPPAKGPAPKVFGVEPNPVPRGSPVKIIGDGFGTAQGRNRVVLGGRAVSVFPRVLAWEDDAIEVQLPFFASGIYELIVTSDLVPSIPTRVVVESRCSQAPVFRKEIAVGESATAEAVVPTKDCGFLIAGRTTDKEGNTDALLVRTDEQGNVIWRRSYGGLGFDEANDVKALHHGYLLAGSTSSRSLDAEGRDVLVMRVSDEGIPVWTKVLGGKADQIGLGLAVHHEHNSHMASKVAVVGTTTANETTSEMDGLVFLMTTHGEQISASTAGAEGDDRLDAVVASGRQGFVAVGRTRSASLDAKDAFRPFAVGLSPDGEVDWMRSYPAGKGDAYAKSVQVTHRGSFAITGQARTGVRREDPYGGAGSIFLLEIDPTGSSVTFTSTDGGGQDAGVAGAFGDGDGGYVLAAFTDSPELGAASSDPLLLDLNCRGGAIDARHPGATGAIERIFGAARLPGDSYVVAGEVEAGRARRILLATDTPFADDSPEIQAFTGNEDTAARVRQGDPLTLRWRVKNADAIRIERLGENGPPLDLELGGGALVDQTFTFDSFSLDGAARCESEGSCGDAIYRVTAGDECTSIEANLVVTVMPLTSNLSQDEERLLEIESMVVQRFDLPNGDSLGDLLISRNVEECDAGGNCSQVLRLFGGSHPNSQVFPPQNICIGQSGFPYANAGAAGSALVGAVDDGEPALLSYAADGRVASWSYGRLLFNRGETTPPAGLPIPDSAWFGHYSGWHTGDGGMTIWGVDETMETPIGEVPAGAPLIPPFDCPAPPEFGAAPRATGCGAAPGPFIFHPSAWDTHFFRDLDGGGVIRVGRFANEVGLSDPCSGAPIVGNDCETGDDPLMIPGTSQRASLFPFIDFTNGTFIPTACGE